MTIWGIGYYTKRVHGAGGDYAELMSVSRHILAHTPFIFLWFSLWHFAGTGRLILGCCTGQPTAEVYGLIWVITYELSVCGSECLNEWIHLSMHSFDQSSNIFGTIQTFRLFPLLVYVLTNTSYLKISSWNIHIIYYSALECCKYNHPSKTERMTKGMGWERKQMVWCEIENVFISIEIRDPSFTFQLSPSLFSRWNTAAVELQVSLKSINKVTFLQFLKTNSIIFW